MFHDGNGAVPYPGATQGGTPESSGRAPNRISQRAMTFPSSSSHSSHQAGLAGVLERLASALGIRRRSALLLLLALVVAFGTVITMLPVRHAGARRQAQQQLNAIAEQRVRQLLDWRQERLSDGWFFSSARFAAEDVQRWLEDPASAEARELVADWLGSLQGEHRYYQVMILDRRLERRLALPAEAAELTLSEKRRMNEVLQSGEVVLTDLEIDPGSGRVFCDVLFPIFSDRRRQQPPFAAGLLRANARSSLFPRLQRWPIPSRSAETMLVRREGDEVLYLNDLRHSDHTALSLRRPLSDTQLPAAQALRGETDPFEGIDYRGVPVVAVGRHIPGTAWALVAKVDRQEIYGPIRAQLLAESAVLGSALLASAMAGAFLWQKQRSSLLRGAAAEWERTFDSVPDLISICDKQKRVLRVNRALAERMGRSKADCIGLPCPEWVLGGSPPLLESLHQQTDTGRQPPRTGMLDPRLSGDFHITTAPLFDERGLLTGTVHVARDITERKKAEEALCESREAALRSMADAEMARREAEVAALALRQSEALLQKALEAPTVGVLFFSLNGQIHRANATFERLCGYDSAELAQLPNWMALTAPEFWDATRGVAKELMERGSTAPYEKQMVRKDGTRWWGVFAPTLLSGQGADAECVEFILDITERKRTEEALRESHERIKRVLEVETVGVIFWDLSTGCMTDANDTFLRMMGYHRGEVEAGELSWQRLTPPEYLEASLAEFRKFQTTGRVGPYEKEYYRKDGTRQWLVFAGSSLGNNASVEFCVDISARKRAEEALRESESRFRTLADNMSQFAWMTDEHGTVSWYNQRWYEYTGATEEEMRGRGWMKVHHPSHVDRVVERLQQSLDTGEPWEDVFPLRRQDGQYRWFLSRALPIRDDSGRIVRWFGTNTDITAQKEAEESLRQSEANYRAVFEQAAIGIGRVSFADAQWIDVNETFCRMLGYSPAEMRATPWPRITHPEDVEKDLIPFRQMAAGELNSYSMEKRLLHKQGHHLWARLTLSLVRDAKGRPDYEVAIIEDITERVHAEESLKASLREKEVLLKEIHHRVKNNMQVLSSLVSLQAKSLVDGHPAQISGSPALGHPDAEMLLSAFDDLRNRVRSMALIHEKLYQSENLAAVDFAAYAESLLQSLWHAHRCTAAIQLNLDLEPMSLSVDRAVPCGLLLNELASNALKHAFRGRSRGTVTVASRHRDGHLRLTVTDDGVGLPPGLDWRQASTLGLQLVQMLSRQMQAQVDARQPEQGGTEFELTFPAVTG